MSRGPAALLAFSLLSSAAPLPAQVPAALEGRLNFQLGGMDAGFETYRVERIQDGYRISGDVDMRVAGMHIVQHIVVEADSRLGLRTGEVRASLNQDSLVVAVTREGGRVLQERAQGDSTVSSWVESPENAILLTNNVIHHIVQFTWLHEGDVGESQDYFAFPRVPVTVRLEHRGRVERNGETLSYRRYFLNLANRVGAYVWLAADGTPLKVLVPLQSFSAVEAAYAGWGDLLSLEAPEPESSPEPAEYASEEVRFDSDGVSLAGTLTLPRGQGPWPAVILISGSGPQDRDENTPGPGGLKLGIFHAISDTLSRRGLAVLRYDDRGVGASGGDLRSAGLSDLVADVQAAVRYLRGRPEVDGAELALVGHSEGGIIAPIVAAADPELAAIVLMAGTATPLDSVMVDQVVGLAKAAGADSTGIAEAAESVQRLLQIVREGRSFAEEDVPAVYKTLAGSEKWLREHMAHDPLATIRKVRAPVLIVNGGEDVQVAPEHAQRLGEALRAAGHSDYEVKIFPRLNHLFAVSRGEGTAEYSDPEARVDPSFLGHIADWLARRLPHGGRS